MNANNILDFLAELRRNNNREWFAANKDKYLRAMSDFEKITERLIAHISLFDKEIAGLQAKDCIFRIYRDVRFSHDKSPYKNHFGAYICAGGGRKSERAGYYLHLELGNCMLSGGIYMPQPAVLKALRQAVYDNIDEFKGIVESKQFTQYFILDDWEKLKTVPRGFPKDFPDAEYIKHKHYSFLHKAQDDFFLQDDFVEKTATMFKEMYPANRFLNYTVDEVLGL
jgi:uncharacterized protein (TIGR02453 family)